jgi:chromate transporter
MTTARETSEGGAQYTPERSLQPTTLLELARLFAWLGATAFGGPAAHIALMQNEVVRRRQWLSDEKFMDLLGATNLIPGPNSTELAMHIGWERRGGRGLLVAGSAFIVPAMLLTLGCGWAYVRYGALPEIAGLLYGVKPVVLAVVLQAIVELAPKAAKTRPLRVLGFVALSAALVGADELAVLFGTATAAALLAWFKQPPTAARPAHAFLPALPFAAASLATQAPSLPGIFGVFLKIGSVLFGSGYVLLAFLRADLVARLHWLTTDQLMDAVAVGQVTPGPVFTTATFIGYILSGPLGALVATAGIFLPAFVFVALSGPLVPRLRASKIAAPFLDGLNVASLALMAVVTAQLGSAALVDVVAVGLAAGSAFLLLRYKLNPTWLVLGGALFGVALQHFQLLVL